MEAAGDLANVEAVLNRLCINPMQSKVNDIRGMAMEAQEDFNAAKDEQNIPNAGSKALIKLRGELVRLYGMQQDLAGAAQSDSEKDADWRPFERPGTDQQAGA